MSTRPLPKGDYVLVRDIGLTTEVLSVHITPRQAEAAMRRLGGEPGSLFTNGMRVCELRSKHELLRVQGKLTIRPIVRLEDDLAAAKR